MGGFTGFDASQVEFEENDFDVLPAGSYQAMIVGSQEFENKKKTGRVVKFEWQITGEKYNNRRVWQQINYKHKSAQTQKIGQEELARVITACGKTAIKTTEELHGINCMIRVAVEKGTGDYPDQNKVKGAKSLKAAAGKKGGKKPTRRKQVQDELDDNEREPGADLEAELDDEIPF